MKKIRKLPAGLTAFLFLSSLCVSLPVNADDENLVDFVTPYVVIAENNINNPTEFYLLDARTHEFYYILTQCSDGFYEFDTQKDNKKIALESLSFGDVIEIHDLRDISRENFPVVETTAIKTGSVLDEASLQKFIYDGTGIYYAALIGKNGIYGVPGLPAIYRDEWTQPEGCNFSQISDFLRPGDTVYAYTYNNLPMILKDDSENDVFADYAVVGSDDSGEQKDYILMNEAGKTYQVDAENLKSFLIPNLNTAMKEFVPHFGDILRFRNIRMPEEASETVSWTIQGMDEKEHAPQIVKHSQFTIAAAYAEAFEVSPDSSGTANIVLTKDGQCYTISADWVTDTYRQGTWDCKSRLMTGEEILSQKTVFCLDYHGRPVAAVRINPTGDANGDGAVNILDVIAINRAVLGKEILPAERISDIDFNQNRVPDSSDALAVMKLIIGLNA